MSHLKERAEKNCLNCNTTVQGKYCHVCGQENLQPEESVWHLVTHFFNDITHFDGKFFSTLKFLIIKPGFLSREYKAGRRASYLNPVRMYIFTSAIFFLVFFSVIDLDKDSYINRTFNDKTLAEIEKLDSAHFDEFTRELNEGKPMTRLEFQHYKDTVLTKGGMRFSTAGYKSRAEYDSLRKAGKVDHGWFERMMAYREIDMNEKYKGDQDKILSAFVYNLLHTIPKLFFISLPLIALVLTILYARQKKYYYVSHAIFCVHVTIFVFIVWFAGLMLGQLNEWLAWKGMLYVQLLLQLVIFFYWYKAMRNFYQQGRGKTVLKYIFLLFSMFLIMLFLFIVIVFFSIMNV